MIKYFVIISLLFSCSKERTPQIYTFDASKDTSFVVSKSSPMAIRVEYEVKGQLQDSSMLIISYYKSKGNANIKLDVPLSSGIVNIKDRKFDFMKITLFSHSNIWIIKKEGCQLKHLFKTKKPVTWNGQAFIFLTIS